MSDYIEADYHQGTIFPVRLEDFIDSDHPARFIREFVDSIDLNKEGVKYTPGNVGKGCRPYSPRLLLCAWLYGYMAGIRSTRKIEKACMNDLGMLWLTGMHSPDHNTLWRFWNQNKKLIKGIFNKTVKVALKLDLIGMVCHALDGTKIMSVGSKETAINKKHLEERLEKLSASIDELMSETSSSEKDIHGDYRLKQSLQDKKELKKQVEENLKILEEKNVNNYHKVDTDAQMMKMKSGNKEMGYNAQVVVDKKSGIIVGEAVFQDQNDSQLLNTMYDKVEQELGTNAEANLADSGYYTEAELKKSEDKNRSVLVNRSDLRLANNRPFHKSHFKYSEEKNVFICPHQSEELTFERKKNNKKGNQISIYRCHCKTCPLKAKCSKDPRGKTVEVTSLYEYKLRHDKKLEIEANKEIMKQRGSIVEIAFAHIKEHSNFRRFAFMTKAKASIQWSMICAAQNLKKIYNQWLGSKSYI